MLRRVQLLLSPSKMPSCFTRPPSLQVAATAGDEGLKFLLIAGQPIGEPIVQHGPFVMNTEEEIRQAFYDYQTGRLQNPDDDVWASDEAEL